MFIPPIKPKAKHNHLFYLFYSISVIRIPLISIDNFIGVCLMYILLPENRKSGKEWENSNKKNKNNGKLSKQIPTGMNRKTPLV